MTSLEATNIIIQLHKEGWDGDKINAFIAFIETHKPTPDELQEIIENKLKD